jgi:hypothetical protein
MRRGSVGAWWAATGRGVDASERCEPERRERRAVGATATDPDGTCSAAPDSSSATGSAGRAGVIPGEEIGDMLGAGTDTDPDGFSGTERGGYTVSPVSSIAIDRGYEPPCTGMPGIGNGSPRRTAATATASSPPVP